MVFELSVYSPFLNAPVNVFDLKKIAYLLGGIPGMSFDASTESWIVIR